MELLWVITKQTYTKTKMYILTRTFGTQGGFSPRRWIMSDHIHSLAGEQVGILAVSFPLNMDLRTNLLRNFLTCIICSGNSYGQTASYNRHSILASHV